MGKTDAAATPPATTSLSGRARDIHTVALLASAVGWQRVIAFTDPAGKGIEAVVEDAGLTPTDALGVMRSLVSDGAYIAGGRKDLLATAEELYAQQPDRRGVLVTASVLVQASRRMVRPEAVVVLPEGMPADQFLPPLNVAFNIMVRRCPTNLPLAFPLCLEGVNYLAVRVDDLILARAAFVPVPSDAEVKARKAAHSAAKALAAVGGNPIALLQAYKVDTPWGRLQASIQCWNALTASLNGCLRQLTDPGQK